MSDQTIIPPRRRKQPSEFFSEAEDLASMPAQQLRELLEAQVNSLSVKANSAALNVLRELDNPELSLAARGMLVKELIAYGMYADAVCRQRAAIKVDTFNPLDAERGRPTVEIPKSLSNADWEAKYADKFLDKTAKKTN